jgi:predicted PurR-regulated permease PerM
MAGKPTDTRPNRSNRPHTPRGRQPVPRWYRLHLWEIQPIRDALLLAAIVGLIVLGYELSIVTVPLLLALLLAYLFEPLVRYVARRKWMTRQGAALAIVFLAAAIIVTPVVLGTGFAIVQAINYSRELIRNVEAVQASVKNPDDAAALAAVPPGGWRSIRDTVVEAQKEDAASGRSFPAPPPADPSAQPPTEASPAKDPAAGPDAAPAEPAATIEEPDDGGPFEETRSAFRRAAAWTFHWFQENGDAFIQSVGKRALGTGADAALAAVGAVTSVGFLLFFGFLTAFFFYFISTGWGSVLAFWESLIPERKKDRAFDLLTQMDRVIAGFVRGRLIICGCLMVYYTGVYALIGVPAALILGPIVGLLALLPYVAGLGMPIASILMWLEPSSGSWQSAWWWVIGGPILATVGAQILDDYILTPTIQGKTTQMEMPTIVFASIAGGVLGGVYGLLLAIPVAACIKILLKEVVWPRVAQWAAGKSPDPLPLENLDETKTT